MKGLVFGIFAVIKVFQLLCDRLGKRCLIFGDGTWQLREVKVKAPDLIGILFPVVHVKYHGAFQDAEIKHSRGVVCDHQVADDIKIIDIVYVRDVDDLGCVFNNTREPDLMMGAE